MKELLFPILGLLAVFFGVVPLLSFGGAAVLRHLSNRKKSVDQHGNAWRFALIVGPVLAPVIWLASAVLHQTEQGQPLVACVVDHLTGELCLDIALFGAALLGLVLMVTFGLFLKRFWTYSIKEQVVLRTASSIAQERVLRLCAEESALDSYQHRIQIVDKGLVPICTRGIFYPVVQVESETAQLLDDDELKAALLHEVEHARAGDPLRFFIAQVALALNPFGRLLRADFERYCFAREAICDRRAVLSGAKPLALASSIVQVAALRRSNSGHSLCAALTGAPAVGPGVDGIRVRVHFLLSYSEQEPCLDSKMAPLGILALAAVFLGSLPHFTGTVPLDVMHENIEAVGLLLGLH